MIRTLKFILAGIAILISFPVFLYIVYITYIELSEETISQVTLSTKEIIKVTKKIEGSFSGPGFFYRVYYKPEDKGDFRYVVGWKRPPGQETIETYVFSKLLVLLTPKRDQFSVRDKEGQWRIFYLDNMFQEEKLSHRSIKLEKNHYPGVMIKKFDQQKGQFIIEVSATLERKYIVTLSLLENGKEVRIISVSESK